MTQMLKLNEKVILGFLRPYVRREHPALRDIESNSARGVQILRQQKQKDKRHRRMRLNGALTVGTVALWCVWGRIRLFENNALRDTFNRTLKWRRLIGFAVRLHWIGFAASSERTRPLQKPRSSLK